MDFEENVSDFATYFFRSSGRGYGDAGEVVWWWLRDEFGVSWVALSVECAYVDEMTNGVSVISHVPILLGGGECGHINRRVMLPGQSRPSRAGDHQGHKSRTPPPFIHSRPHGILGLCLRLMPITAD